MTLEEARRQVEAVVSDDGWTACKCAYRFGFRIVATGHDARVKCPKCGAWVMLPPPASVYDDRPVRRL